LKEECPSTIFHVACPEAFIKKISSDIHVHSKEYLDLWIKEKNKHLGKNIDKKESGQS